MVRELSYLRVLEAEAVFVMREVAAEFERPVLLFSGGKDSIVLLRLPQKAFRPPRLPLPILPPAPRPNFPGGDRFPRPPRRRARGAADRRLGPGLDRPRPSGGGEGPRRVPQPPADRHAARRHRGARLRRGARRR